jgi:hypothetical protein
MMFAAIKCRISKAVLLLQVVLVIVGISAPHPCLSAATEEGQPKSSALSESEKNFIMKLKKQ